MADIEGTRLDQEIARQAYTLDCLRALRDIYKTGDCNICASKKECEYVPKPGQMVRYNCPFYKAESEVTTDADRN